MGCIQSNFGTGYLTNIPKICKKTSTRFNKLNETIDYENLDNSLYKKLYIYYSIHNPMFLINPFSLYNLINTYEFNVE